MSSFRSATFLNVRRMVAIVPGMFALAIIFALPASVIAQTSPWQGRWITDHGEMAFEIDGKKLSGKLGPKGRVTGSVNGSKATIEFKSDKNNGKASLALSDNEDSFTSTGQGKKLRGWKLLENTGKGAAADFSGPWVSNWGNMVLQQTGNKVTGIYGSQGLATLEGTVEGRRLNFSWKKLHWTGQAFIEQNEDGTRIYGTTINDDTPTKWIGVKPQGYDHHASPKAGEIVKGYADNGMLYHLRMPDGWTEGDPVDVIVLFHGSNFTTLGMVHVTAKNWPEIGKKFAILGIQGDRWADWSDADDLRHNYFYVNWMGRSTYQGYPYTDRESPSLVMEVIEELGDEYVFERTFVGGHSQGGYLTYTISMHFPDKVDGTFPIAGGMMIQCEPDVFDDEDLKAAQRKTPMVILHGKNDRVVQPSVGEYAYNRLLGHGFHNVKFLNPPMGHPYDFLPVDQVVEYLDALTTDNPDVLLAYTEKQLASKDWRTVGFALQRADELGENNLFESIRTQFEAEAKKQVQRYTREIRKARYGKWVDRFLRWHDDFALSASAKPVNDLWDKLVDEHSESAKALSQDARKAFNSGQQKKGWDLRKQIVLQNFAAPEYRTLRDSVEKKFGRLDKLVSGRRR